MNSKQAGPAGSGQAARKDYTVQSQFEIVQNALRTKPGGRRSEMMVLSMQIEQFEHRYLLTGGHRNEVSIYKIDPESRNDFLMSLSTFSGFAGSELPINLVHWYTIDSGLLGYCNGQAINISCSNEEKVVQAYDTPNLQRRTFAFHPTRGSVLGIGYSKRKFSIEDIRQTNMAEFPCNVNSNKMAKQPRGDIEHMFWDPVEQDKLWMGDTNGQVYQFDVRNNSQPYYELDAPHLFQRPLLYFGFTPDNRRLVTCHGFGSKVTVWKYGRERYDEKRGELVDTKVRFNNHCRLAESGITRQMHAQATNVNLFLTNDKIFLPNLQWHSGPHVFVYNSRTGEMETDVVETPTARFTRPYTIIGYKRTCYGDEPNATLLQGGVHSLYVLRRRKVANYSTKPSYVHPLHKDFWSDTESDESDDHYDDDGVVSRKFYKTYK